MLPDVTSANAPGVVEKRTEARMQELAPGVLVHNPDAPDWGVGQVQSVIGTRVTVNFEHAGKQLVDIARATLQPLDAREQP